MDNQHTTARSKRIHVAQQFKKLSTRPEGIQARDFLSAALRDIELVELDFSDAVMTPSFAEEFIGRLAASMGMDEFARRVHLDNVSPQTHSLLKFVIARSGAGQSLAV